MFGNVTIDVSVWHVKIYNFTDVKVVTVSLLKFKIGLTPNGITTGDKLSKHFLKSSRNLGLVIKHFDQCSDLKVSLAGLPQNPALSTHSLEGKHSLLLILTSYIPQGSPGLQPPPFNKQRNTHKRMRNFTLNWLSKCPKNILLTVLESNWFHFWPVFVVNYLYSISN